MPIYEFYCRHCNTIFSFFSAAVRTDVQPPCPRCAGPLAKRPSTFATLKHRGETDDGDDALLDSLDESRFEGAMAALAQEMEQAGESEDPRQVGRLFRKFGEMSGLELGPRMEDALRRLEAGEDLDSVESEMEGGDEDESLDEFFKLKKAVARRRSRPAVDDTLYFL